MNCRVSEQLQSDLLTLIHNPRRISFPVPLKHLTETAHILVLGLFICVLGFFLALIPEGKAGLPYWSILLTVSVLYPVFFIQKFRVNRADYELRLLHWFPAGMVVLWLILQGIGPRFWIGHILALGFLFLWSLPLVALGLLFLILFSYHVVRRRNTRIWLLSIFLALFTLGSAAAEAQGWNERVKRFVFKATPLETFRSIGTYFQDLQGSLAFGITATPSSAVSASYSSSHSSQTMVATAVSSTSSSFSSVSSSLMMRSSEYALPPPIATRKPNNLTSSGPEDIVLIGVTMLALYAGILHARARKRA